MKNESGITPLGHRVLVKVIQTERKTDGGIIIPEKVAEQKDKAQVNAVVIAVGSTAWSTAELGGKPWAEPGDTVVIGKYSGVLLPGKDGENYRVVNDTELQAKLE